MNKWGIPQWLENEVRARDTHCVYCGIEFSDTPKKRGDRRSWEHIINDAKISPEVISHYAVCHAMQAKAKSH